MKGISPLSCQMEKILLIFLAFQTPNCFGQQWIDTAIDKNITISLPHNYQITDTLGQRLITAQVNNGLIFIQRIPKPDDPTFNISNKDQLDNYYNGLIKGTIKSSKGELLSSEFIKIIDFNLIKFSFKIKIGDELQIHDCLGLFLNGYTYLIQLWHLELISPELQNIRDNVFSSLKISSTATQKDQYIASSIQSSSFKTGYIIGKILGPILLIGIFAYLIYFFSKRRKIKMVSKS